MLINRSVLALGAAIVASLFLSAPHLSAQESTGSDISSSGIRIIEFGSGTTIKMLLDAANLGSDEIEVAAITFPVGTNAASGHRHGATEIFYVLEGVLGHEVNGESVELQPGMVGVVRVGDEVIHSVIGDQDVKALVIWVPGGESDRIAPRDRWRVIGGR